MSEYESHAPAHMKESQKHRGIAHDLQRDRHALACRDARDQILKENYIKLGFTAAFARTSVLALKEIPANIEGDLLAAARSVRYRSSFTCNASGIRV